MGGKKIMWMLCSAAKIYDFLGARFRQVGLCLDDFFDALATDNLFQIFETPEVAQAVRLERVSLGKHADDFVRWNGFEFFRNALGKYIGTQKQHAAAANAEFCQITL